MKHFHSNPLPVALLAYLAALAAYLCILALYDQNTFAVMILALAFVVLPLVAGLLVMGATMILFRLYEEQGWKRLWMYTGTGACCGFAFLWSFGEGVSRQLWWFTAAGAVHATVFWLLVRPDKFPGSREADERK